MTLGPAYLFPTLFLGEMQKGHRNIRVFQLAGRYILIDSDALPALKMKMG
jgi:hypothetical protein